MQPNMTPIKDYKKGMYLRSSVFSLSSIRVPVILSVENGRIILKSDKEVFIDSDIQLVRVRFKRYFGGVGLHIVSNNKKYVLTLFASAMSPKFSSSQVAELHNYDDSAALAAKKLFEYSLAGAGANAAGAGLMAAFPQLAAAKVGLSQVRKNNNELAVWANVFINNGLDVSPMDFSTITFGQQMAFTALGIGLYTVIQGIFIALILSNTDNPDRIALMIMLSIPVSAFIASMATVKIYHLRKDHLHST